MNTTAGTLTGRLAVALVLAGIQISTACVQAQVQEELHKTYPLAANGQVALANVNGKIVITTWDRDEVKLDAVKRANRQADLDLVKIEIEAKPDRLQIKSKHPESKRRSISTSVDYTLTVPRQARLASIANVNGRLEIDGARGEVHASVVNGTLLARHIAGDAGLSSVNGTVEAGFDHLDGVKSVSLSTVNGKLMLALPDGADADVAANTVNGRISADQPLAVKSHWPIGHDLKGTLGKGGTRVKLSSVNGSIHIQRSVAR